MERGRAGDSMEKEVVSAPSPSLSPPIHPAVAPLSYLLGKWRGEGEGGYPTINSFKYGEELLFSHSGKPVIAYSQKTWKLASGEPMHAESGYWRPKPNGSIEVVIAQSTGLVEVQVKEIASLLTRASVERFHKHTTIGLEVKTRFGKRWSAIEEFQAFMVDKEVEGATQAAKSLSGAHRPNPLGIHVKKGSYDAGNKIVTLQSELVGNASKVKEITRVFNVVDGELSYVVQMATHLNGLQPHLKALLKKL